MAAESTIQHLQRRRSDSSFDQFYSQVVVESKDLTSPRHRYPPKRIVDGTATAHEFAAPEDYFRKQYKYFEVLDLLINELKQQKHGMPVVAMLEKLLLDSASGKSTFGTGELPEELQLYKNDIELGIH